MDLRDFPVHQGMEQMAVAVVAWIAAVGPVENIFATVKVSGRDRYSRMVSGLGDDDPGAINHKAPAQRLARVVE